MKWNTEQGCAACGFIAGGGSVLHHLLTRGAYPEHQYKSWNLFPCCIKCHACFHKMGTNWMVKRYPDVKEWLIENGWEFEEFRMKWVHPKQSEY